VGKIESFRLLGGSAILADGKRLQQAVRKDARWLLTDY